MLNRFSKNALTHAIHSNFHSLLRLMCEYTQGFEWVKREDVVYMVCDIPTSIYNRVVSTKFDAANVDDKIGEVSSFYLSKGLPFLWMVGSNDSPCDLPLRLEGSGFVRSGSPGMAIDLRRLKEPASPSGFRVEQVQYEEGLLKYSALMPQAFGFDELSKKAVTSWIQGVGLCDNLHHYLGYLGDKPVATSSLFYADGVAGLYCVASMPEARGRGLGSLMSAVPLLAAREEGYKVGVLHSTLMAHGVYLRLGFKDYSEIINYSRVESGDSYLQTLSRQR
jgi:ribosomal protein S18 acetylase RimI-like enzyme